MNTHIIGATKSKEYTIMMSHSDDSEIGDDCVDCDSISIPLTLYSVPFASKEVVNVCVNCWYKSCLCFVVNDAASVASNFLKSIRSHRSISAYLNRKIHLFCQKIGPDTFSFLHSSHCL
eukprot:1044430_1